VGDWEVTVEDRRKPPPPTLLGYIDHLPSRVLLNRLPVPIWAIQDNTILYANRAFEDMLGSPSDSLTGAAAADLIADHVGDAGSAGAMLRQRAGALLNLHHADGSVVTVIVSQPMLMRANDPVTLVGVQDVTEHLWERGH
jgi:PAS domain S-box-containing protein